MEDGRADACASVRAEIDACDEHGGVTLTMPRADRRAAWRWLAETELLNRAMGSPEVDVRRVPLKPGVARRLVTTQEVPSFTYEEEGYAWETERYWSVRRELVDAPLRRFLVLLELADAGAGTRVEVRFGVSLADPGARAFAQFLVGHRLPTMFGSLREALEGATTGDSDGFEDPGASRVDDEGRALLDATLRASGEPAAAVSALLDFVSHASDVELVRFHPKARAARWGVTEDEAIDVCLRAARLGFLTVDWSLACPACRGQKGATRDLVSLFSPVHCDDCNVELSADPRDNIALTFRPADRLRRVRDTWACVGGPARTPHVIAQWFLDPGEQVAFRAGSSCADTRQWALRVAGLAPSSLTQARGRFRVTSDGIACVGDDERLVVTNDGPARVKVSLEDARPRRDLLLARDVVARPRFRELFLSDQWEMLSALSSRWADEGGQAVASRPEERRYDLIVVGGGPAGEAAAITAGGLGRRVALVEARRDFGGSSGLSSKAFRETALRLLQAARGSGGPTDPDALRRAFEARFPALLGFVASLYRQDVLRRLSRAGVTLIHGSGELVGAGRVDVATDHGTKSLHADHVLVATGSRAAVPEHVPLDQIHVRDAAGMTHLRALPRSIAVIGAGVIGLEYATVMAALGVRVDLVTTGPLLPFLDREIANKFEKRLLDAGIRMHRDATVRRVQVDVARAEPVELSLSDANGEARPVLAEMALWAMGRLANTECGVPAALRGEGGRLLVDRELTAEPGLWGAGDVLGPPGLASTSATQGKAAALAMFNGDSAGELRAQLSPTALWTLPEVGTVGLGEEAARDAGVDVVTGRATFRDLPRGLLSGDLDGTLKLVADRRTGRIVGVHVIGDSACELVHYGAALVDAGTTAREIARRVFAAATFHGLYEIAATEIQAKRDAREGGNLRASWPVEAP